MTVQMGAPPVLRTIAALEDALDGAGDARCWGLSDAEVAEALTRMHRVGARVDELRLRLVAQGDSRDLRLAAGATSTTAWLAGEQRTSRRAAGRDVHLAADLDRRREHVRTAMARGALGVEQAQVICLALRRLPDDLVPEVVITAERHLVEQAATYGPEDLRRLGNRILDVVAPDVADDYEARLLERQEQRARAAVRLWMRPQGDGKTSGGFCIPDAQAGMLQAALDALSSPRRPDPLVSTSEPGQVDAAAAAALAQGDDVTDRAPVDPDLDQGRLPYEQRLGLAFCELIEHLPVGQLPDLGRATPVLTITLDPDSLHRGVGTATLSNGERMTAAQARRLACTARLLPMVLGGDSVPLDLGRSRRYFTWHQRIALAARQGGCVADGCWRPPAQCEAHHCRPWLADNGPTDLDNGALLCPFHHHLVHDRGWRCAMADDGIPEMIPPPGAYGPREPIRHRRFRQRAGAPARQ